MESVNLQLDLNRALDQLNEARAHSRELADEVARLSDLSFECKNLAEYWRLMAEHWGNMAASSSKKHDREICQERQDVFACCAKELTHHLRAAIASQPHGTGEGK